MSHKSSRVSRFWRAVAAAGFVLAAGSAALAQTGPPRVPELRGAPDEEAPPPPGLETAPLIFPSTGTPPLPPATAPPVVSPPVGAPALPAPVASSPTVRAAPVTSAPLPVSTPSPTQAAPAPFVRPAIPPAPRPLATPRVAERPLPPPTNAGGSPVPVLLPPSSIPPVVAPPRPTIAATPAAPPAPPPTGAAQAAAPVAAPIAATPAAARAPANLAFASTALASGGVRLAQGPALCVAARNGLGPALETGGRVAVLAPCDSRSLAVQLVDGVLYVGANRTHILTPLTAPVSGCRTIDTLSQQRRTLIGVCVRPDANSGRLEEDLRAPGWGRIDGAARGPGPAFVAGAPLMVAPVSPENPIVPAWSYAPASGQLRTSDGSLCVGGVTGDLTTGAPLLLRPCGERPLALRF